MTESYAPFEKVIRGFDPKHEGVYLNGISATLDGGCGFGGSLVAASMTAEGEVMELMEV
jgi:serine/threonine protein phosphatase 1